MNACTFPDCDCTGRDAAKCAKYQRPCAWPNCECSPDGECQAIYKPEKPRYRIQWAYNLFGPPLGYWITPYLSNGELDLPDMRNYKQSNLPTECLQLTK